MFSAVKELMQVDLLIWNTDLAQLIDYIYTDVLYKIICKRGNHTLLMNKVIEWLPAGI